MPCRAAWGDAQETGIEGHVDKSLCGLLGEGARLELAGLKVFCGIGGPGDAPLAVCPWP